MAADQKTLTRIANLLRLASPSSGTTEAERANAALEVAKLVAKHGLVVAEPPPPAPKRRRPPAPAPRPAPPPYWQHPPARYQSPPPRVWQGGGSNWTEATVVVPCHCVACGARLYTDEVAWFDSEHGFRCWSITCDGQ